jgi:hypothetical protein
METGQREGRSQKGVECSRKLGNGINLQTESLLPQNGFAVAAEMQ